MHKKSYLFLALLMLSGISGSVRAQGVDPGVENLTHSWTFDDGTADDLIGNATGNLMGSAYVSQGALNTTAEDSWLELPAESIAINAYTEITIEAWFQSVAGGNTAYHMLASFGNTQNTIGANYYFVTPVNQNGDSRAAISCGNTSQPWAAESGVLGDAYDDGLLHHIVSTIDADSIKLYIDGVPQGSAVLDTNNSLAQLSVAHAYLAKSVYDSDPAWRGYIHEFNMYSKALSAENILFLFDEGNDKFSEIADPFKPVVIEVESGDVGSDFNLVQEDSIEYVTIQTNRTEFNPGSRARIVTFEVTFPDTGVYDLFVRLRVGPGSWDDDSFFYGNGFGVKDSLLDSNWILINGLAGAGFSEPDDVVHELGGLGSGVWKWVNISNDNFAGDTTFTIAGDSLTRTVQIGGRETGLDIDKIAFGKSKLYFTVGNLDSVARGSSEIPEPVIVWEGPPLASKQSKFVGNVYSAPQINNFESYWNQVTPENAGKWGSVEGTRDNMNWGDLDAAYKLAKDNDFPIHFHVLIWGAQQPSWISSLEPAEQLEEIREWFQAVANRYPEIDFLEVVNEPLPGHNPPDGTSGRAKYKDALGGNGETGWDWVLNAFRMAREIFPASSELMLNDFGILGSTSATSQYLKLIRLLQAENLIDIIGVQGHAFTTTASTAIMKRNLDSLATTGIPIQVTELDIDGTVDSIQLQNYQRIFPALYEHPGVEGITLWGWRPGLWRNDQGAYLLNQNGSERPALEWMRQYLDTLNIDYTAIEDIGVVANEFGLYNNYPNPFNPATHIQYSIGSTSKVTLSVFDMLGREIQTLVNDIKAPGRYTITFNAEHLASGIYFYRLRAGSFSETKKFILLR
ncbi:endo-1,4-beta-xylanase [candidate division KSB1 bacterium]|nr:endo-1,4-beta-xylanase [candidate division KSB1 bacterium]